MFSCVQIEFAVFQSGPNASCPNSGHYWEESAALFFIPCHQVLTPLCKVPLSLLQAEHFQFSWFFLAWKGSQSLITLAALFKQQPSLLQGVKGFTAFQKRTWLNICTWSQNSSQRYAGSSNHNCKVDQLNAALETSLLKICTAKRTVNVKFTARSGKTFHIL